MKKLLKSLIASALTVALLSSLIIVPVSAEATATPVNITLARRSNCTVEENPTGTYTVTAPGAPAEMSAHINLDREYLLGENAAETVEYVKIEMDVNTNNEWFPFQFRIADGTSANGTRVNLITYKTTINTTIKWTLLLDLKNSEAKLWKGNIDDTPDGTIALSTITKIASIGIFSASTYTTADTQAVFSNLKQTNYSGVENLYDIFPELDTFRPKVENDLTITRRGNASVNQNGKTFTITGVKDANKTDDALIEVNALVNIPTDMIRPIWGGVTSTESAYAKFMHISIPIKKTAGDFHYFRIGTSDRDFEQASTIQDGIRVNSLPSLVAGRDYQFDIIVDGDNKTVYYYVDNILCYTGTLTSLKNNKTTIDGMILWLMGGPNGTAANSSVTVTNPTVTCYYERGSSNNWNLTKVKEDILGANESDEAVLNFFNINNGKAEAQFYGNVGRSNGSLGIFAVYDENYVLKRALKYDISANQNRLITISGIESGDKVKVFLWDSLKLAPLCGSGELTAN